MLCYLICEKNAVTITTEKSGDPPQGYELLEESLSSRLGFYNWIIDQDSNLIGVNFLFVEENNEIIKYFISRRYKNVQTDGNEVNIFFHVSKNYLFDYSNEFINFNYFKSPSSNIALSFEIPAEFEYDLKYLNERMRRI